MPETENEKHHGWTNVETWLVHLWITNEEASDRHFRALAKNVESYEKEREFRDEVDAYYDFPADGLQADLLGAAMEKVNWGEIVKALRE